MAEGVPLRSLRCGERAVVVELPTAASYFRKLAAFGILPGMELKVLQVFPAYVLGIGNTRLALDEEIAGGIKVRK